MKPFNLKIALVFLNILVISFIVFQVYSLSQPVTVTKTDTPKPQQAKDNPGFKPITLPDENYKIPKPATRKEAVDDRIEKAKNRIKDEKTDKVGVVVTLLDVDNWFKPEVKKQNIVEFNRRVLNVVDILGLKDSEYGVYENTPEMSIAVQSKQLDLLKSIPDIFKVSEGGIAGTNLVDSIPQISDVTIQSKQFGSGQDNNFYLKHSIKQRHFFYLGFTLN